MMKYKSSNKLIGCFRAKDISPLHAYAFLLLLLLASCSEEARLVGDSTAVNFSLSGIEGELSSSVTRGEKLAAGTTVRVVAYKGSSYVADNTYTADANGILTSTAEMRLIADTYDFYAVSPALGIASKTTSGPTFSVGQGVDFAAVKVSQQVTAYSGSSSSTKCSVALGELARKCAKLTFNIAPGSDIPVAVSLLKVTGITLTGLPTSLTATGDALTPGSGSGTLTIPASAFTSTGNEASGSAIVLPKTSGTFTMSMDIEFNGSGIPVTFPAITVAAMSFDAGKSHVFTIKLMKDRVGIWAAVYPTWTGNNQSGGFGGTVTDKVTGDPIDTWTDSNQSGGFGGTTTGTITGQPIGVWTSVNYSPGLGSSNPDNNS